MATEFTNFPTLPSELRRKIWSFCMPEGRVFEFDLPHAHVIGTTCSASITSIVNARPPSISQVCRESRDVAFTEGGFLSDIHDRFKARGLPELPDFDEGDEHVVNEIDNPWFCPKTDTVHLNWDDSYTGLFDSEHNPIPVLIAHARIAQGGSIRADQLLSFEKEYPNMNGHPRDLQYTHWSQKLLPLECLNRFKVCILIINIHTTDTRVVDSGLFGSLATPIQLVNTSDRETIHRMYKLWWTTFRDEPRLKDSEPEEIFEEMILTPDNFESRVSRWHEEIELRWLWKNWIRKFHEGTLHTIDSPEDVFTGPKIDRNGDLVTGLHPWQIRMPEHAFNKAHPWVQTVLHDMPRFQSVIMFRYCNVKCYVLGRPKVPKNWGSGSGESLSFVRSHDREMEKLFWKNPFTFDPQLIQTPLPSTESPRSKKRREFFEASKKRTEDK
ncbi:hypothetical protein EAF04_010310 [Stromatinia cepivora]|nr:hypothetical protein EAF04_010310 [Stromatinia cepivora]